MYVKGTLALRNIWLFISLDFPVHLEGNLLVNCMLYFGLVLGLASGHLDILFKGFYHNCDYNNTEE